MSNRGLLSGAYAEGWRSYVPTWRSSNFGVGGAAITTQPDLGNGSAVGRYLRFSSGMVVAQMSFTWGTTTTFGTSAAFYIFSLPFPASRSNSAADLPLGAGMVTQEQAASPRFTQMVIPTLADPGPGIGGNSNEDYWVQGFCQRLIAAGVSGDANSPAFASGQTAKTVTHNLGVVGGFIPNAYDIDVMATNSPSTNPKSIFVDTIGATTFNVNVGVSSTTTPLTYAWKIRAEPNSTGGILIGPNAPWAWSTTVTGSQFVSPAAGGSIAFECIYEARR